MKSLMPRFSLPLFFILCFIGNPSYSQQPIEKQSSKSVILPEKTIFSEDISYKNDKSGNPVKLDIYQPKGSISEKLPVVIYVHGGAWAKGDKTVKSGSYIEDFIVKLVEKNYVVISIDYSLVSETVHFPQPIEDTKDAVKWVRKNAEKYNFDVHNIGFFGVSSGAHLSMLAAYTKDDRYTGDPALASYSGKVNYVVNNFGPTDLNSLLHTRMGKIPVSIVGWFIKPIVEIRAKLIHGISGYDINTDKRKVIDYFKTISPISDAENGVPTLILHGDKDRIAPIKQSKKMIKELNKYAISSSLLVVKDGIHGFGTTDKAYMNELNEKMLLFIISHTNKGF